MVYHIHVPDQYYTFFVGTDKEQIKKTIQYYIDVRNSDLLIPSDEQIKTVNKLEINCMFPMLKINHFIDVKLNDDFILHVNANAFDHVRYISQSLDKLKRGDLYKFNPGMPHIDGIYLLPEQVMKSLENYPWDQHSKQIDEWLAERERDLTDLEDKGFFKRH